MKKLILFLVLGSCSLSTFAFSVYRLDGNGSAELIETSWSLYNSAPATGTEVIDQSGGAGVNWTFKLGDFNAKEEDDIQESGIYGVYTQLDPAYGYQVRFRFDGYSWDAYNGGPTDEDFDEFGGYFDLFSVNINQQDTYENLVDGGTGSIADPILPVDPAGEVVVHENTNNDPDSLPGKTWAWGGHDYAPYLYEEEHGFYVMNFFGNQNESYFLNVSLDTTGEFFDEFVPSYGCFSHWNVCGFEAPIFGDSQDPQADGGNAFGVPEPTPVLLMGLAMLLMTRILRSRGKQG